MKTMKTIMLSSALVLGATLAHAQDPARPTGQGATSTQPGITDTAPAHEPFRADRGNTARNMDAPVPTGIAPQPRAGAANPMNDPARPDADGATD